MPIPNDLEPDISLALEPRPVYSKRNKNWPRPHIVEAVAGRVRILNPRPLIPMNIFVRYARPEAQTSKAPTSSTQ